MTLAIQTAIVMVVLLVIMLAMGVSISISVGLSSAVAMLCMLPAQVSFVTSAQRLFAGANSFSLIAIPFFILAGNLMNNGGIAERLVTVAKAIAGLMPGALAQTNITAVGTLTSGTWNATAIAMTKGGTGATSGATGLKNLLAAGNTILSSYQYGSSLPSAGTKGRLFFKTVG